MKSRKLFNPPDNSAVLLPYPRGGIVAQTKQGEVFYEVKWKGKKRKKEKEKGIKVKEVVIAGFWSSDEYCYCFALRVYVYFGGCGGCKRYMVCYFDIIKLVIVICSDVLIVLFSILCILLVFSSWFSGYVLTVSCREIVYRVT